MNILCLAVVWKLGKMYISDPADEEITKILRAEKRCGTSGLLGSIDCFK